MTSLNKAQKKVIIIGVFVLLLVIIGGGFLLFYKPNETTEEQTTNEVTIAMPYTSDKVSVAKDYYNREDDSENQEKSLIFYENTYMPFWGERLIWKDGKLQ